MDMPHDLSAEARAWMGAQLMIAQARQAARTDEQLQKLAQFTDGLFVVLVQLVPGILRMAPDLASRIGPHWETTSQRFASLDAGIELPDEADAKGVLEARALLYDVCRDLGVWSLPRKDAGPAR